MTPDALALDARDFRAADFLKTSGALIVGFRIADRRPSAQGPRAAGGPSPGSPPINQLDSWIAIAADGSVTAYSGKEELGQGISTAQAQLVAEELSVPFDRVKLIYCDTALTPDQAYTSGSQSHPANFNHGNLAQAGATAREALFRLASERLGVPVDQLTAADGSDQREGRSLEESHLRPIGGRQEVQPRARSQSQAQTSQRMDRAGNAGAASRSARYRHWTIRVRPQRALARHAAWPRGAAAGCGRHRGQRRRKFGRKACRAW